MKKKVKISIIIIIILIILVYIKVLFFSAFTQGVSMQDFCRNEYKASGEFIRVANNEKGKIIESSIFESYRIGMCRRSNPIIPDKFIPFPSGSGDQYILYAIKINNIFDTKTILGELSTRNGTFYKKGKIKLIKNYWLHDQENLKDYSINKDILQLFQTLQAYENDN